MKTLGIRLSDDEWSLIVRAATEAQTTPAKWLRKELRKALRRALGQ
jgi:hypothetical protein